MGHPVFTVWIPSCPARRDLARDYCLSGRKKSPWLVDSSGLRSPVDRPLENHWILWGKLGADFPLPHPQSNKVKGYGGWMWLRNHGTSCLEPRYPGNPWRAQYTKNHMWWKKRGFPVALLECNSLRYNTRTLLETFTNDITVCAIHACPLELFN